MAKSKIPQHLLKLRNKHLSEARKAADIADLDAIRTAFLRIESMGFNIPQRTEILNLYCMKATEYAQIRD